MNLISIKNLYKSFNGINVLDDVSLNIKSGTITGFIGRNGSGKTVLLKIIAGLYYPSSGEVKINENYNIYDDFGFLIDTNFLDNLDAFDNLKTIALLKGNVSDYEIKKIIEFVLLDPDNKQKYKFYSTGMKQKLKIAQALMEKPKVIILDEPFNGLDKESVLYFRNILLNLKKEGCTIIITSHYKEDIDCLCDIVYEFDQGKMNVYEEKEC